MIQYIDKDALVAELRRRIKSTNNDVKIGAIESLTVSKTLNSLISFLDTLEVKEVDLEEEARKWQDKVYLECGYQDSYGTPHAPFHHIGDAFIAGAEFMIKVQKGE